MIGRAEPSVGLQEVLVIDLDRTITRQGTYSFFLLFAAMRLAPWRLVMVPAVVIAMVAYKANLISRKRLKEIMFRLILGRRVAKESMSDVVRKFAQYQLQHNIYPQARGMIAAAGDRPVILATAAHRFYAETIAAALDIPHVVATDSVMDATHIYAAIEGENCYGIHKTRAISALLARFDVPRDRMLVYYVADDISDLPSFEWSEVPIVVNAKPKLAALAAARTWPVLDWRRSPASSGAGAPDDASIFSTPSHIDVQT